MNEAERVVWAALLALVIVGLLVMVLCDFSKQPPESDDYQDDFD